MPQDPITAIKEVEAHMSAGIDHLVQDFSGVRTGKASPALIDFGAVRLGDAAERELTVQNDGTEAVTLFAAPLPGLSLAGGAITAAPGATTALLRYRPPGYAPLDTPPLGVKPNGAKNFLHVCQIFSLRRKRYG
jgi:hypothetical protein